MNKTKGCLIANFATVPSFATEVNSSGLSVFHGETIDLDHAICLTTAVLSVFDLPEMVTITAAFTCSKSRTDEFGGMTILVTKDTHYYQDGCQFSRLMNEAHKAGMALLQIVGGDKLIIPFC
ncbi:hypothetical protein ACRW5F_28765 [Escherichia coli]